MQHPHPAPRPQQPRPGLHTTLGSPYRPITAPCTPQTTASAAKLPAASITSTTNPSAATAARPSAEPRPHLPNPDAALSSSARQRNFEPNASKPPARPCSNPAPTSPSAPAAPPPRPANDTGTSPVPVPSKAGGHTPHCTRRARPAPGPSTRPGFLPPATNTSPVLKTPSDFSAARGLRSSRLGSGPLRGSYADRFRHNRPIHPTYGRVLLFQPPDRRHHHLAAPPPAAHQPFPTKQLGPSHRPAALKLAELGANSATTISPSCSCLPPRKCHPIFGSILLAEIAS